MKKLLTMLLLLSLSICSYAQYDDAVKYAETITQADLKDNLTILASDAMEGRETGERGQKMAAAFIAFHFEKLGLKPVVKEGTAYSYFQKINLEKSWPGETYVTVNGKKLMNGEELAYWGRKNMTRETSIEVVFLGDGNENVFHEVDVKGKAVVILASGSGFRQWRALSGKAQDEGALLTLLAVADDEASFNALKPQLKRFGGPSLGFKQESSEAGGVFMISQPIVSEIFGVTAAQLKKAADSETAGKKGSLKKIKNGNITYLITRKSETVTTENVLGLLEGTDKKEEILVVSSHYDHIGRIKSEANQIPSGQPYVDEINNGADDDGSGTTSVMEIAQAFAEAKKAGKGPRRSILFLCVTGEEKGLLGSQYYVEHPVFPLKNTVADLNIDMIGRFDPEHRDNREFVYLIGSNRLSTELHELSEKANDTFTGLSLDYTYNDEKHPERIYYRSDHWNFAKNGIPIIFYFSGVHADYHKPSDTVDKIEFDLLQKRARLVYYTAWILANKNDRVVVDKLQETTITERN